MLQIECLCTLARRSSRMLTDIYDRALEPSGLKVTQYSLLKAINHLKNPSLTDLSVATGLERSTLGRNLRLLAQSGLVSISQGKDERTRVSKLTFKAKKSLRFAEPLWQDAQRKALAVATSDTKYFFVDLNKRIETIL
jgi:DNA-binding MarR family transcriptional regulator